MLPSPMLGFKVLLERIQVVFFGEPIVTFGAFYVNFIGLGGDNVFFDRIIVG